jgi:hypothetical protein
MGLSYALVRGPPRRIPQEPEGRRCASDAKGGAGSRRSGVGLAPRPQALPMPATALVLYILAKAASASYAVR